MPKTSDRQLLLQDILLAAESDMDQYMEEERLNEDDDMDSRRTLPELQIRLPLPRVLHVVQLVGFYWIRRLHAPMGRRHI